MTNASHLASMSITPQDELAERFRQRNRRQWRIATGEVAGVESLSFRSDYFSNGAAVDSASRIKTIRFYLPPSTI